MCPHSAQLQQQPPGGGRGADRAQPGAPGFRVLGFRVTEFRPLGFRVTGIRVQGHGVQAFRVQGSGSRSCGFRPVLLLLCGPLASSCSKCHEAQETNLCPPPRPCICVPHPAGCPLPLTCAPPRPCICASAASSSGSLAAAAAAQHDPRSATCRQEGGPAVALVRQEGGPAVALVRQGVITVRLGVMVARPEGALGRQGAVLEVLARP